MKPIKMNSFPTPENQHGPNEEPVEGARRATGAGSSLGGEVDKIFPNPEVPEKKPRRNFTAAYKLRILQKVDLCTEPGQVGRLLRREGLYSSNLTNWRRARDNGLLQAMSPRKRGRKLKEKNPLSSEVAQLQKENRQLEHKLKQANLIIEAQKKISQVLGIIQNIDENNGSN
jgi:transposase-like protein